MKLFTTILALASTIASATLPSLTPDNYDSLTNGKTVFILFCTRCVVKCGKVAPELEKVSKEWEGNEFALVAKVDCTHPGVGWPLCERNDIHKYPTFKCGDPSSLDNCRGGYLPHTESLYFDTLSKIAKKNLCSPKTLRSCDDDMKAKIHSDQDLAAAISYEDERLDVIGDTLKKEVEELQSTYKKLIKENQITYQKLMKEKERRFKNREISSTHDQASMSLSNNIEEEASQVVDQDDDYDSHDNDGEDLNNVDDTNHRAIGIDDVDDTNDPYYTFKKEVKKLQAIYQKLIKEKARRFKNREISSERQVITPLSHNIEKEQASQVVNPNDDNNGHSKDWVINDVVDYRSSTHDQASIPLSNNIEKEQASQVVDQEDDYDGRSKEWVIVDVDDYDSHDKDGDAENDADIDTDIDTDITNIVDENNNPDEHVQDFDVTQSALAATSTASSVVPSLTPDNYISLTNGKTIFIKFFAPWCAHSKKMAPDWERLSKEWEGNDFGLVAEVDCTGAGNPICQENDIGAFPTLLLKKYEEPSSLYHVYKGDRSFNALSKFAKDNMKPSTKPLIRS